MKKVTAFFTAVLMLLTAFPLTVFAENSGEIFYSVISEEEKTCKITGADSNAWELTIPAELDGYKVIAIGREAFCDCEFEKVNLPNTLKYIERYAFYYCQNLSRIIIPNSVTYIDDHAFEDCPISYVCIPSSVATIEAEAFGYYHTYTAVEKIYGFAIIGTKGGAAEAYAKANGFKFLLFGDVHTDSNVTAVDARWVLQAAAGLRALQFDSWRIADVNQDGVINSVDARWVLQTAAGMRTF